MKNTVVHEFSTSLCQFLIMYLCFGTICRFHYSIFVCVKCIKQLHDWNIHQDCLFRFCQFPIVKCKPTTVLAGIGWKTLKTNNHKNLCNCLYLKEKKCANRQKLKKYSLHTILSSFKLWYYLLSISIVLTVDTFGT